MTTLAWSCLALLWSSCHVLLHVLHLPLTEYSTTIILGCTTEMMLFSIRRGKQTMFDYVEKLKPKFKKVSKIMSNFVPFILLHSKKQSI